MTEDEAWSVEDEAWREHTADRMKRDAAAGAEQLLDPERWIAWLRNPDAHVGMADRYLMAQLWERLLAERGRIEELADRWDAEPGDTIFQFCADEIRAALSSEAQT